MKGTAHIEDWEVKWGCLMGRISGHRNQKEFTKDRQITSGLVKLDEHDNVAETYNTIYTLGEKHESSSFDNP